MDFEKEKLIIRALDKPFRKKKLAELGTKAFADGVKFVYGGETVTVAMEPPPREGKRLPDGSEWFPYKPNGRLTRDLKTGQQAPAVMGKEIFEEKNVLGQIFKKGEPCEANTPAIAARCLGSGAFSVAPEEKPKKAPRKKAGPVSLEDAASIS